MRRKLLTLIALLSAGLLAGEARAQGQPPIPQSDSTLVDVLKAALKTPEARVIVRSDRPNSFWWDRWRTCRVVSIGRDYIALEEMDGAKVAARFRVAISKILRLDTEPRSGGVVAAILLE